MTAVFHVAQCKQRGNELFHPKNNQLVGEYQGTDCYVIEVLDVDTSQPMATFIMPRDALEQLADNCQKTLSIEPLSVRRADS